MSDMKVIVRTLRETIKSNETWMYELADMCSLRASKLTVLLADLDKIIKNEEDKSVGI